MTVMDRPKPTLLTSSDTLQRQVQGGLILLLGRGCAICLNLATQVMLIRYLAKSDFGALAYALSCVEMMAMLAMLSLDKSFARFGAVYHERQQREHLAGSLCLVAVVPLLMGTVFAIGVVAFPRIIVFSLSPDSQSMALLVTLAWLIPIQAFAAASLAFLTVLMGARAVFFRKHLLGPLLKLGAVAFVMLNHGSLTHVAVALILASCCGLAIDLWLGVRLIHNEGLWQCLRWRQLVQPLGALIRYNTPMLLSDLAYLASGVLMVVVLGSVANTSEAAAFRAVLPIARLNHLVLLNFALLFTPLASRLMARQADDELVTLHRSTAGWIMILSFPLFAGSVLLARPLTLSLFGHDYADSAVLLVILATGCYVEAVFGLNERILKVLGLVWPSAIIDSASAVLVLVAAWFATPIHGAVAAAILVFCGVLTQCTLKAIVLWHATRIHPAGILASRPYQVTMVLAITVLALGHALYPGWVVGGLMLVLSTATVLLASHREIGLTSMLSFHSKWQWGRGREAMGPMGDRMPTGTVEENVASEVN